MEDYSMQHKKAWEFDAYDFWVRTAGTPAERAARDMEDPKRMLKQHAVYFDFFDGVKVANICGSCGKKAVPLAILGADVTVFDISEDNKKYAVETAEAAGVKIGFEVCDIMKIDMDKYAGFFDVVFMEGGILHYFHDIDAFITVEMSHHVVLAHVEAGKHVFLSEHTATERGFFAAVFCPALIKLLTPHGITSVEISQDEGEILRLI